MKGSIQKRGAGTWRIRFTLSKSDGKRKYYSETFKGKKAEAEERLSRLLSDYHAGQLTDNSKLTIIDFLKQWLNGSLKGSVSRRTFSDYSALISRYIESAIGNRLLVKLSPAEVQELYNQMRLRNLSPRTIRYTHNVLCKALNQATRWGLVYRNVALLAELPKQESKEQQFLQPKQAQAFLRAAKSDRYAALWQLAIDTGMRPEEYLALRWGDIQNGVVSIQRVLCVNRSGGGYYFDKPKTKQSRRSIPLTATTLSALNSHRLRQAKEKSKTKLWEESELIFTNSIGRPVLMSNLTRRHFKPLLKKANLPESIRLYDLRHTCATLLLSANVHPKVVQERLGHSTIKLTLDTYSHVLPGMQEAASLALQDQIFRKTPRKTPNQTSVGDQSVTKNKKAAR